MPNTSIEPLYNGDCVPIVFSCDAKYAIFVGVVVQNIIRKASAERNYDIIILELGLEDKIKREIAEQAIGHANISIRFFNLTSYTKLFNLDAIPINKRFTKEVFFPLFVPDLCRHYPKALYLDPDILIERDLADLYDVELGDAWVGATIDYECTHDYLTRDNARLIWRRYIVDELGLALPQYCNSGILVFNIQRICQDGATGKFIEALSFARVLPDQDSINYVCRGRMHFLDPRWNVQSFSYARYVFKNLTAEQAKTFLLYQKEARIIHYTYLIKPWFHAGCRAWWRVAKETVFFERICRDFLFSDVDNGMLILRKEMEEGKRRKKLEQELRLSEEAKS